MTRSKKLKLTDKILIAAGIGVVIFFAGWILWTKRAPRHYYIPADYSGWVVIRYEQADAGSADDGEKLVMVIPADGMLEVSDRFEGGWARDKFFRGMPGDAEEIPSSVDGEEGMQSWIHGKSRFSRIPAGLEREQLGSLELPGDVQAALDALPADADTILWDGTVIRRTATGEIDIRSGRVTEERFYLSSKPEGFEFQPPAYEEKHP